VDVALEQSVSRVQSVNDPAFRSLHNGQIFQDGLSFSGFERDRLWINQGPGSEQFFADLSDVSGADSDGDGRAVLAHDFDDDGDVDLFVHSIQRERHLLFRNDTLQAGLPGAGFLKVRLVGTRSNVGGVGAIVLVDGPVPAAQVMSRGSGFVSCLAPELVFGLGGRTSAEVSVIWPGGVRESFGAVPAGARLVLEEGEGKPFMLCAMPAPLADPPPAGLLVGVGATLPPMDLVDLTGKPVRFDMTSRGGEQPVVLSLWATTCAPCVAELPDLGRIQEQGRWKVITLCLDPPGDGGQAADLLERAGVPLESFLLSDATAVKDVLDLARLPIPTAILLDADGTIRSVHRGPLSPADLD